MLYFVAHTFCKLPGKFGLCFVSANTRQMFKHFHLKWLEPKSSIPICDSNLWGSLDLDQNFVSQGSSLTSDSIYSRLTLYFQPLTIHIDADFFLVELGRLPHNWFVSLCRMKVNSQYDTWWGGVRRN